MILFVLYIEPLIRRVSESITGFLVYDKFLKVIVFADDFNIIIRNDDEFDQLLSIFDEYAILAKIRINLSKSEYMRFNQVRMGPQKIREVDSLKILGITFCRSWYLTVNTNYNRVINNIKHSLSRHYIRNLNLYQKCWILNIFILSKVWYLAQIFPPLNKHIAQLKSICGKFLWNGFIFKIERNQMYLDYMKGGLNLIDPEAKIKALFLRNILYNPDGGDTTVEEKYLLEMREAQTQRLTKNAREWIQEGKMLKERFNYNSTRHLYNYFVSLKNCTPKVEQNININWAGIWENINMRFISTDIRSMVFCFVNDIITNGKKLSAYNIRSSQGNCRRCGIADSNFHRLKECPKAKIIWEWCSSIVQTRYKISVVDLEDLLPFSICKSSQQQKAALWLTMKVISFNLTFSEPSLFVFKKEIREERWNNRKFFASEFGSNLNIC